MNTLVIVALALISVIAASGPYPHSSNYGYRNGFQRVYNGIEAAYNNAGRQHGVNQYAEGVGAGTGTAKFYGVPGTGNYFGYGYNRYHDSGKDRNNYL